MEPEIIRYPPQFSENWGGVTYYQKKPSSFAMASPSAKARNGLAVLLRVHELGFEKTPEVHRQADFDVLDTDRVTPPVAGFTPTKSPKSSEP